MQYECFQGNRAGVCELRVPCTLANVRERSCAVERPFMRMALGQGEGLGDAAKVRAIAGPELG